MITDATHRCAQLVMEVSMLFSLPIPAAAWLMCDGELLPTVLGSKLAQTNYSNMLLLLHIQLRCVCGTESSCLHMCTKPGHVP
jgi:hypothetical protein